MCFKVFNALRSVVFMECFNFSFFVLILASIRYCNLCPSKATVVWRHLARWRCPCGTTWEVFTGSFRSLILLKVSSVLPPPRKTRCVKGFKCFTNRWMHCLRLRSWFPYNILTTTFTIGCRVAALSFDFQQVNNVITSLTVVYFVESSYCAVFPLGPYLLVEVGFTNSGGAASFLRCCFVFLLFYFTFTDTFNWIRL